MLNDVFFEYTQDILQHPRFKALQKLPHHGKNNSVFQHSVAVAMFAFKTAQLLGLSGEDARSVTRAALLHDFFCYDWHSDRFKRFSRRYRGIQRLTHMHGFIHGPLAAARAERFFELNEKQREAIRVHMFPLYLSMPKHKEAWIVTFADKVVATREISRTVSDFCGEWFLKGWSEAKMIVAKITA